MARSGRIRCDGQFSDSRSGISNWLDENGNGLAHRQSPVQSCTFSLLSGPRRQTVTAPWLALSIYASRAVDAAIFGRRRPALNGIGGLRFGCSCCGIGSVRANDLSVESVANAIREGLASARRLSFSFASFALTEDAVLLAVDVEPAAPTCSACLNESAPAAPGVAAPPTPANICNVSPTNPAERYELARFVCAFTLG